MTADSVTDTSQHARQNHQQLIQRARQAVDWLAEHPEIRPDSFGFDVRGRVTIYDFGVESAAALADMARAVGGRWQKRESDELFKLIREVADGVTVELVLWREQVCERVVTGTREVEVEEPDPDAVAALPKVKRTETVEEVEWRCESILNAPGVDVA